MYKHIYIYIYIYIYICIRVAHYASYVRSCVRVGVPVYIFFHFFTRAHTHSTYTVVAIRQRLQTYHSLLRGIFCADM